jgi:hypothetical protein
MKWPHINDETHGGFNTLPTTSTHLVGGLKSSCINPLNAELNPIHHLLALVEARHIVHVSRVRVNNINNNDINLTCQSKTY